VTTPSIRKVLSANIGKALTPELACEIELAAVDGGQAINPASFGEVERQGYEIRAERFADIVQELHPLHQAHWLETEKYRHGLKLNPDYQRYAAIEAAGGMVQFTVRKAGALVGNMRMFVSNSLHTQTPVATEDTIFLLPEHRGGFLVMALLRFAEQALTSIGITEIRSNSKLVNRADVLLRRMGYEPFGIQMVKFYEGASDVR
jgi:hypothetical protein